MLHTFDMLLPSVAGWSWQDEGQHAGCAAQNPFHAGTETSQDTQQIQQYGAQREPITGAQCVARASRACDVASGAVGSRQVAQHGAMCENREVHMLLHKMPQCGMNSATSAQERDQGDVECHRVAAALWTGVGTK